MDIEEFLNLRQSDIPTIVANVRAHVGLSSGDLLLAVGSLAEGLGNSKSDLDLLLVTPSDASSQHPRELALVVGKCLSDVQVLRIQELDELLNRFNSWANRPWSIAHAAEFSLEERRLLHRLLHSIILFQGHDNNLVARLPTRNNLARLKLHATRHLSRTIQVDMVGNRESDDYSSLVFASQELLGQAADALASGYYFTNPTPKWRSRILELLPSDWDAPLGIRPTGLTASELFWQLHRAPERPNRRGALEHSFRIATFARGAFAWAERKLLGDVAQIRKSIEWPHIEREPQDLALPFLDIDVDYHEVGFRVSLARLNEFQDPIELSSQEFAFTMFFDGITTEREARYALCGIDSGSSEQCPVAQLVSRLTNAGLCHSSVFA